MAVIGIVPAAHLFETDDYYQDYYRFVNNYPKRIIEHGGIPVGLLPGDGHAFLPALEQCDAFLFCGGNRIFPYHFEIMDYAVRSGKKVLGVCLGMQVLHSLFIVSDEAEKRHVTGDLLTLYEQMKREKYMFTEPVDHHWDVHMVRDHVDEAKHPVQIMPGTHLSRLLGRNSTMGATMHRYRVTQPSPRLTVSARAADGTVEALEYGENVLGVQFHPEVDNDHAAFFEFLCR